MKIKYICVFVGILCGGMALSNAKDTPELLPTYLTTNTTTEEKQQIQPEVPSSTLSTGAKVATYGALATKAVINLPGLIAGFAFRNKEFDKDGKTITGFEAGCNAFSPCGDFTSKLYPSLCTIDSALTAIFVGAVLWNGKAICKSIAHLPNALLDARKMAKCGLGLLLVAPLLLKMVSFTPLAYFAVAGIMENISEGRGTVSELLSGLWQHGGELREFLTNSEKNWMHPCNDFFKKDMPFLCSIDNLGTTMIQVTCLLCAVYGISEFYGRFSEPARSRR